MWRVVSATALPAGAHTPTLDTEQLQALVCADTLHEQTEYVRVDPLARTLPARCVRARLAPHVAACSLVLARAGPAGRGARGWRAACGGGARAGQELRVWFSPELLAAAGVPFLTPRNIRGKKNYTCHLCSAQFEEPNPLKVHLFLSCKPFSGARFWREFLRRCEEPPPPPAPQWTPPPPPPPPPPATELSRPWECGGDVTALVASRGDVTLHWDTAAAVELLGHGHAALTTHWTGEPSWGAAAEALAAAWSRGGGGGGGEGGAGGGGHRCVYCGRRYSRAYGLKIHVRTHTGYKPLRCAVCARRFGDPSNLNKHVRLHARHAGEAGPAGAGAGAGGHACAACGKLLARRRDLERHVRTRHAHLLTPAAAAAAAAAGPRADKLEV